MSAQETMMELELTGLATGGRGLGRDASGRVVFVAGGLAGERVRARVERERPQYLEAVAEEIIQASSQRVQPRCPLYGRCGGCDLMHLEYAAQVEAKTAWVLSALRRLPGLPAPQVFPSPRPWGYRNRVRWQVEQGRLGFYAAASHELVETPACPVCDPALEALLPELARVLEQAACPDLEWLEGLGADGRVFLSLGLKTPAPEALLAALAALPGVAGVRPMLAGRPQPWPFKPENGLAYHQSPRLAMLVFPGLFSQVNLAANRLLTQAVVQAAGAGRGGSALDLFAGSGNFSLPLALEEWQTLAVEGDSSAAAACRAQAKAAGLENRLEAVAAPVQEALKELVKQKQSFGLVVLDPPRAGAKGLMPGILKLEPRRIIYVSCHPAALARDAQELARAGYAPRELAVVDMFPQTGHVEAMLVLDKS